MPTSCIVSCCTIILYQCHMPLAIHMVCQLYNTVCTIILYQCHMPSAAHMVCRLYNTVIQSNANRLYGFLVVQSSYTSSTCRRLPIWCADCIILSVQSSYTNATCHRLSIWCANCIILSYSPMPTSCMVSWLYNHLIPMPHAIGCPSMVPMVCRQWLATYPSWPWYATHPYSWLSAHLSTLSTSYTTYPSTYYTIYTTIGYGHCWPTHMHWHHIIV
jgi:hypothetical protein